MYSSCVCRIRIDHVLGLFRIWELPEDAVTGISGHFHPCVPIHGWELRDAGIHDIDVLCTPTCARNALEHRLGPQLAEEVWNNMMVSIHDSPLRTMKAGLTTEKAVEEFLHKKYGKECPEVAEELKTVIFDEIFANVCLLRDPRVSGCFAFSCPPIAAALSDCAVLFALL